MNYLKRIVLGRPMSLYWVSPPVAKSPVVSILTSHCESAEAIRSLITGFFLTINSQKSGIWADPSK
jgi:hypothetical protein